VETAPTIRGSVQAVERKQVQVSNVPSYTRMQTLWGKSPSYHVSLEPKATGTGSLWSEKRQAGLAIKLEMNWYIDNIT